MAHKVTDDMRRLRERLGLSMDAFARRLNFSGASSYQRYEDAKAFKEIHIPLKLANRMLKTVVGYGNPPISKKEVLKLAGLEEAASPVNEPLYPTIHVKGTVQAGAWLEASEEAAEYVIPRLMLKTDAWFALRVRGQSINKIMHDGEFVICVDINASGLQPSCGDLVLVRRTRDQGGIVEYTIKRLHAKNGKMELRPESTDPRYQEVITLDGGGETTVEIVAIAVTHFGGLHEAARMPLQST